MNLLNVLGRIGRRVNKNRFGVIFWAIGTDGKKQETDADTGAVLKTEQINFNTVLEDPTTGDDMVVPSPNIAISTNSLDPFPKPGERWLFNLPATAEEAEKPLDEQVRKDWMMSPDRFFREDSLGKVQIFLIEVQQS